MLYRNGKEVNALQYRTIRVVHYLNQFFGGVGAEDKANAAPLIFERPIGPGLIVQKLLGERGGIVATVVCGDNYFVEKIEEASNEVIEMLRPFQPDVLIAGPAFEAGRYGIACGAICQAAQDKLGIPAVAGMYQENAGLELYRRKIFIIRTGDSVKGMAEAVSKMVNLAQKLVTSQEMGKPSEEGYFPHGVTVNELSEKTGAERVIDMLLSKLEGRPFESEVPLPVYKYVKPAPRIKSIKTATIALITDGGLFPKGNPDKIEARGAKRFGEYSLRGIYTLNPDDYEVNHAGCDSVYIAQNPNRLVPLDVMRDLEKEGEIGKLHEVFYSTAGPVSIVENCRKIGESISSELQLEGVSGIILTST